MKKRIFALLAALLTAFGLTACGESDAGGEQDERALQIVTTIFPIYDWTVEILGDDRQTRR